MDILNKDEARFAGHGPIVDAAVAALETHGADVLQAQPVSLGVIDIETPDAVTPGAAPKPDNGPDYGF